MDSNLAKTDVEQLTKETRDALQNRSLICHGFTVIDLGGAFGVVAKVNPAFVFLEEVLRKLSESDTEKAS